MGRAGKPSVGSNGGGLFAAGTAEVRPMPMAEASAGGEAIAASPAWAGLLSRLNAPQRQAVVHDDGPLIVLAGPGTGKTRVIIHRIAHLLTERQVEPEAVVAVTFTVKAAEQMRERLADMVAELGLSPAMAARVNVHTFHGYGYRIVQRFRDELDYPADLELIDKAQTLSTLRDLIRGHNLLSAAAGIGIDALAEQGRQYIDLFANQGVTPAQARALAEAWQKDAEGGKLSPAQAAQLEKLLAAEEERAEKLHKATLKAAGEKVPRKKKGEEPPTRLTASAAEDLRQRFVMMAREQVDRFTDFAALYEHYDAHCRRRGWLSFGDLVLSACRILDVSELARATVRAEHRHFVVDEFQDVNAGQIDLLERVAPPTYASGRRPDLVVVGDDDQAIYGFRGADDRAFTKFERRWTVDRPETGAIGVAQVRLDTNYRSHPAIVHTAGRVMQRAVARFAPDKVINAGKADTGQESPVRWIPLEKYSEDGDAIAHELLRLRATEPGFRWGDCAVIARGHADLERVGAALGVQGIPYVVRRKQSWADEPGVLDVRAHLDLVIDPRDTVAVRRLLVRPPAGLPLRLVATWLEAYAGALGRFESGAEIEEEGEEEAEGGGDGGDGGDGGGGAGGGKRGKPGKGKQARRTAVPRAEADDADGGEPVRTYPDPGSVLEFIAAGLTSGELAAVAPGQKASAGDEQAARARAMEVVSRLHLLVEDLAAYSAEHTAAEVVHKAVADSGVASSELLDDAGRKRRLAALVSLLSRVRTKQPRLAPPGDLQTYLLYEADLDDRDAEDEGADVSERVDGVGTGAGAGGGTGLPEDPEAAGAVQLLTAHASKGLEFPMVFVPRVEPQHGYPKTGQREDPLPTPPGLIDRADDTRDEATRRIDEERRLFYVALTRAENRAYLLAKASKNRSSSTHFLQELTHPDDNPGPPGEYAVAEMSVPEILRAVAAAGVTPMAPDELARASGVPTQHPDALAPLARRRELLSRFRARARNAAALALDGADLPADSDAALAGSAESLADAAARLAAAAQLAAGKPVPTWLAKRMSRETLAEVEDLARTLADETAEEGERPEQARTRKGLFEPMRGPLTISYSMVKAFNECPRCYYLTKVLGLPESRSGKQAMGTAVHKGLELFYRLVKQRLAAGEPEPGLEELLAIGKRAYIRELEASAAPEQDDLKFTEAQLRKVYTMLHGANPDIVELEQKFAMPWKVDGVTHSLTAYIDRLDRLPAVGGRPAFRIIDYKTGQAWKKFTQPEVDDLQMTIYALVLDHEYNDGEAIAGVGEYWLPSTGERGSIPLKALNRAKVRQLIDETVRAMLAGDFDRPGKKECPGPCGDLGLDG